MLEPDSMQLKIQHKKGVATLTAFICLRVGTGLRHRGSTNTQPQQLQVAIVPPAPAMLLALLMAPFVH
jgi:hypothetical protein